MKKFKKIDLWISIVLIAGFAVATVINKDYTFLIGYFVVGGWHVISMLTHIYQVSFTEKKGARNRYHWVAFIALLTLPIGGYLILLFAAPFMAVFYTWLCFDEVRKMSQRPLAILK